MVVQTCLDKFGIGNDLHEETDNWHELGHYLKKLAARGRKIGQKSAVKATLRDAGIVQSGNDRVNDRVSDRVNEGVKTALARDQKWLFGYIEANPGKNTETFADVMKKSIPTFSPPTCSLLAWTLIVSVS